MKKHIWLFSAAALLLVLATAALILPRICGHRFLLTEDQLKNAEVSFRTVDRTFHSSGDEIQCTEKTYGYETQEQRDRIKKACLGITVVRDVPEDDIPESFRSGDFGDIVSQASVCIAVTPGDVYDIYVSLAEADGYPCSQIYEKDRETVYFYAKHGKRAMLCSAPAYILSDLRIMFFPLDVIYEKTWVENK